jgi:CHAT domain
VDDDATRQLMGAYYAELEEGVGRSEAMREVEMLIRMNRETSHPYYWASFIVSGASTPLISGGQGVPGVGRGLRGNCTCTEAGGGGDSGVGAALGAMALGLVAAQRRARCAASAHS